MSTPYPRFYLRDRRSVDLAAQLVQDCGDDAGMLAAVEAEQSRDRDNVIGYCEWRQIERLIEFLADQPEQTRH